MGRSVKEMMNNPGKVLEPIKFVIAVRSVKAGRQKAPRQEKEKRKGIGKLLATVEQT